MPPANFSSISWELLAAFNSYKRVGEIHTQIYILIVYLKIFLRTSSSLAWPCLLLGPPPFSHPDHPVQYLQPTVEFSLCSLGVLVFCRPFKALVSHGREHRDAPSYQDLPTYRLVLLLLQGNFSRVPACWKGSGLSVASACRRGRQRRAQSPACAWDPDPAPGPADCTGSCPPSPTANSGLL